MDLEVLLNHLASDCPWHRSGRVPRNYEVRCGIRFTDWDNPGRLIDDPPAARRGPGPPIRILTLAHLIGPTVAIVCPPCRRRGVYRVASLIARFGAEMPLPTLMSTLSADCPGRREVTPRCAAVFEAPVGR